MSSEQSKTGTNTRELAITVHRMVTGKPKVSVTDACEFVGIGRSTYYKVFPQKKKEDTPASIVPPTSTTTEAAA